MTERYYQSGCDNLAPQPQPIGYIKWLILTLKGGQLNENAD